MDLDRRPLKLLDEYRDQSLPTDTSVKPVIDKMLWDTVTKLIPESSQEISLPKKIGRIDDASVWLVDGDKVRRKFYMDFSYGGHDLVYGAGNTEYKKLDFIPKGQIWLDSHLDKEDLLFSLYHEVVERRLMSKGMSYTKAHEIANLSEREMVRRQHVKPSQLRSGKGYPS